jgi:membrane associated rhomboid family serine protease/Zn-finger nucleic acid-binding protein
MDLATKPAAYVCPRCQDQLIRRQQDDGVLWSCRTCAGQVRGIGLLRRQLDERAVAHLWQRAGASGESGRRCPACTQAMAMVPMHEGGRCGEVEACRRCFLVWLDDGEDTLLPPAPRPHEPEVVLPPAARELLARARADAIAERAHMTSGEGPPDTWWQFAAGVMGMPVEDQPTARRQRPWATWALLATMTVVTLVTLSDLAGIVANWGLVPADPLRHGGLTVLASFFLHGGLAHLFGNAYFLAVFGDDTENELGAWRYVALIAAAAVVGDVIHALGDPRPHVPVIGASAGISGVLAFYTCSRPSARLRLLIPFPLFRWVRVRVWVAFAVWVVLQVWGALQQIWGFSHVSALAHLGGVLTGLAWWLASQRAGNGVATDSRSASTRSSES